MTIDLTNPFLQALSIKDNGDFLEQYAEMHHHLNRRFPNYEKFWKYVICPASDKPKQTVGFLPTASKEIRRISQLSYSTLQNLIQADRCGDFLKVEEFGFFDSNIQACLLYSGNAIQLVSEIMIMVKRNIGKILTGSELKIFDNEKQDYFDIRENIVKYRNYLTHSGLMLKVPASDNPIISFIPKPEKIMSTKNESTVWVYPDETEGINREDYVRFDFAAIETKNKIWDFINFCYGKYYEAIQPFLNKKEMKTIWGRVGETSILNSCYV